MRISPRTLTTLALGLPLCVFAASPSVAQAAGKGKPSADTAPPSVSISAPTSGSTTGTGFTASGSASDNKAVSTVALSLDGGSWQTASGTTSWSLGLSGLAGGSHTLTARASDTSGNTSTSATTFSVTAPAPSPSPSPSSSPSPSPSPSSSPTASPSPSPTTSPTSSPSPSATPSGTSAPNTQGSWVSPEGVTINVNTAGTSTISQVYSMLLANARDLNLIGPSLTIDVQDTYASQTTTSASQSGSTFTNYQATIYLKGVNSTFTTKPDAQLGHEYGHAWTRYWLFMRHGGDWSAYLAKRWSSSDGSVTLGSDSRTGTSYTWDPSEIIADDYRLLFGSSAAISESPNSLNTSVVAPSAQPGLRDWFLSTWA